ncbi:hypothetical protein [Streptomyces aureoversilis]|uniref:Uncharacterized protein n=1 Tax=Streptomyces aureoversilis TaxID=67277 RepID=A0ABW0A455_9ACTN
MSEQYEYFAEVPAGYTVERPDGLWRRAGEQWEYLSLLDWQWHDLKDSTVRTHPPVDELHPVTVERAAALEADRQGWVHYWALYADEQDWQEGEPPTTVVRRRSSPEQELDESYRGSKGIWGPTSAVADSRDLRTSNPPHLEAVSAERAEELLQEIHGVTGATEL